MFGIDNFNLPIIDFSNFNVEQLLKALVFGGSILLIGMLTVFGVLCILWLFLVLFKLVFHDLPKKRSEKQPLTQVVTKETSTEVETAKRPLLPSSENTDRRRGDEAKLHDGGFGGQRLVVCSLRGCLHGKRAR